MIDSISSTNPGYFFDVTTTQSIESTIIRLGEILRVFIPKMRNLSKDELKKYNNSLNKIYRYTGRSLF